MAVLALSEDCKSACTAEAPISLTEAMEGEVLLQTFSDHLRQRIAAATPQPKTNRDPSAPIKSSLASYPGMAKIIAEFIHDLPEEIAHLDEFLKKKDMDSLRRLVHQLRGTCGGYGFDAVTEMAGAAETAIRAGENYEAIVPRIDSLIQTMRRIEGFDQNSANLAA
jgi:HPt (histidine-containing phosphotransfer) domain-containing protein